MERHSILTANWLFFGDRLFKVRRVISPHYATNPWEEQLEWITVRGLIMCTLYAVWGADQAVFHQK
jgi:hypothetical protein